MSGPESRSTPEPALTRQEKERLLQKMYTLPHWIAIIRLFAYRTLAMDQARADMKPIADEFGNEKTAEACENLVEIVPGKEPAARLKSHVRRMAFQILGQEPLAIPAEPVEPKQSTPIHAPEKKPRRKRSTVPVSPTATEGEPPPSHTPSVLMEQFRAAKEKHPDMLLLFRIGDFYELFAEDAEAVHALLGLTLTTRDRTLQMAGFPHHQLETYLHKLLHAGKRVAICDQVDESLARGPIRREVTRVVTPEAAMNDGQDSGKAGAEGRPIKQPRHYVLKQCEAWMKKEELAFVPIADVKRTTPAVAPFVGSLDFIVLRGEEKLLLTVRPSLQKKHLVAIGELRKLFGPEYRPVRIWPADGPDGWVWQEHAIAPDLK